MPVMPPLPATVDVDVTMDALETAVAIVWQSRREAATILGAVLEQDWAHANRGSPDPPGL